ncbi:MAG: amidase family protein [Opitutales bacterium]
MDPRPNFSEWRKLAKNDYRQVVEAFFTRYNKLSVDGKRAFIATHPERGVLLQRIKAACIEEDEALAGVPYFLQDMFDTQGLPTQCGAAFDEPFEAPVENTCLLAQILANQGATYLAKTVPTEFGWDMCGQNRSFGDSPHTSGLSYVSGGGAGTCAYAVADGWVPIAFGLDTCGGIRIPAAFHGLFGFRMENNRYARDGVFPIVPSLDSVGWMTANVEDLLSSFKLFYNYLSHSTDALPRGFLLGDTTQNANALTKAGLMKLIRSLDVDEDPARNKLITPIFQQATKAFQVIQNREMYSVHRYWIEEYGSRYDPRLLKQIKAGRTYSPAESEEASHVQQNLRAILISFFREYDYLVLPVSPVPTPEKTEWDTGLEEEILNLNAPLSLSFLPALILPFPCGEGVFNAAQIIVNPKKMQIVPKLLEQLRDNYA